MRLRIFFRIYTRPQRNYESLQIMLQFTDMNIFFSKKIQTIGTCLITLFSVVYICMPMFVYAQGTVGVPNPNPTTPTTSSYVKQAMFPCDGPECTFQNLVTAAQEFSAKLVQIGLIVAPLIFAYAGYLYIMSGLEGNAGKRKTATGIFKNVAIGIIIMMLAWVLVNTILNALVCGVSNGQWFAVTGCPK